MRLSLVLLATIASSTQAFTSFQPRTFTSSKLASDRRNDDAPVVSLHDDDNNNDNDNNNNGPMESEERHIPTAGISISDEMVAQQRDTFVTQVVPVQGLSGVAQLVSHPLVQQAFEPVRYLVALSPPQMAQQDDVQLDDSDSDDSDDDSCGSSSSTVYQNATFALVDVPPYSPQLVTRMRSFMGLHHRVAAIIVTSSDAIYSDEVPTELYSTTRRAALLRDWQEAFPEAAIISYRLDTPRECRELITQRLDGQGPFAWNEATQQLEEMGRPLQIKEWDQATAQRVLENPQDADSLEEFLNKEANDNSNENDHTDNESDEDKYSPEAIRAREEGKRLLAVYTPGHSYGSLSLVFPEMDVVCSGYTIPVEDNRADEHDGFSQNAGPALDVRGYITTSRAGMRRKMESARRLVRDYADRFTTVLPSQGDPLMFDEQSTVAERQEALSSIIDQYDKIGQIYEQLGITGNDNDGEDSIRP